MPQALTNRKHGSYSIRQELPPREDGSRRSFSRAGCESLKAAQTDLNHVHALLGLSDADDPEGIELIAVMLEEVGDEGGHCPTWRRPGVASSPAKTSWPGSP